MLRAVVTAKHATLPQQKASGKAGSVEQAKLSDTSIFYEGRNYQAVIYAREKLQAGAEVSGPAIIAEMDSTTLLLPDHIASVDAIGNLLINPINCSEA
jgi:N-methylhydantoinase A